MVVGGRRCFARQSARGLALPDQYMLACEGYREADGEAAMRALLAAADPPTAVLAGNDMMALGCCSAIAEAGLQCPRDISVVGFNDMPLTDRVEPALTTVRVPYYDIGREAAELLVRTLADERTAGRSVRLTPTLVVRDSTAAVR